MIKISNLSKQLTVLSQYVNQSYSIMPTISGFVDFGKILPRNDKNLINNFYFLGTRTIYAASYLGIDLFKRHSNYIKNQQSNNIGNISCKIFLIYTFVLIFFNHKLCQLNS